MQTAHKRENAANFQTGAAVREALYGNAKEARTYAAAALDLSHDRNVEYGVAFVRALTGDIAGSQALAQDLDKRFPEDTYVRFTYLPTLKALWALSRGDASAALDELQTAVPYEFAVSGSGSGSYGTFSAIYLRGCAHVMAHRGPQAAAEFQKIIDHFGVGPLDPVHVMARLQLARALRIAGNNTRAKAAYQDFLRAMEERRPGHSDPEGRAGRIRQFAVNCLAAESRFEGGPRPRMPGSLLDSYECAYYGAVALVVYPCHCGGASAAGTFQRGDARDLTDIVDGFRGLQIPRRIGGDERVEVDPSPALPDERGRIEVRIEGKADDLAPVIDGVAAGRARSIYRARKSTEILHAGLRRPQEAVLGAIGCLCESDYLAPLVDAGCQVVYARRHSLQVAEVDGRAVTIPEHRVRRSGILGRNRGIGARSRSADGLALAIDHPGK